MNNASLVPFRELLFTQPQKESSACEKHSYGGLLFTPLAFLTYLARICRVLPTHSLLHDQVGLCSTLLLFRCCRLTFRTNKKTRGPRGDLGIRSQTSAWLAWVCCPLVGSSLFSSCEVVLVAYRRNISASARAGRPEQHR